MEILLGAFVTSKADIIAWGAPSFQELVVILVIVLIIFGAKRLPELARSLGQSMNEFRKAKDEFEKELHKSAPAAATSQSSEEQKVPALQPAPQIVSASAQTATATPSAPTESNHSPENRPA